MRPQASYIVWHDGRPAAYVALSGKIHQPGCRYYVAPNSEVSIGRVEPSPEFWDRCCAVCFRGEQHFFELNNVDEAPAPAAAPVAPPAAEAPLAPAMPASSPKGAPEAPLASTSSRGRRKQRRAASFIARPRRLSRPQAFAFIAVVGGLILLVTVSGILQW